MGLLLLQSDTDSNPRTLFASGEQGGYYDPSVANTLFQLADGVTAATQPGDPVGLILDSRKGGLSNLGSDLVTNGTFAADSDWTKGANWTIGSGVATKTGGAANNLTQTISSTAGAWYRLTMDVTRTAGTLTVSLGTSGTTYAISASGTYTFMILAGSSTQTLTLAGDSSFAGTVDNVTARNVPGNHLYQTVSGSRGSLSREPDGGKRNLLTNTDTMATQSLTVRAVQYTLSFTGTGTVTLSGASTAGPLVGTGASDVVSLTFTPTAASLTLTVSGTVTLAQLETGAARSGYQKNTTQYNCTESGKRDCWAIDFDGSDDSYLSSSVDFAGWTADTRRNLATETDSLTNITGHWTAIRATDTYNQTDPFGGTKATLMVINSESANGSQRYWQQITTTGNYRFSVYVKKNNHRYTAIQIYTTVFYIDFDLGTISGGGTIQDVGNGWFRVSATANMATAGYCYVYAATGAATISSVGLNTLGCYVYGGQIESGSAAATAYQSVGTDKMTVWAGVWKRSDAATAMLVELSSAVASNNGSFFLTAPLSAASPDYALASKGTVSTGPQVTGFAAPVQSILCAQMDISGDLSRLRVNQAANNITTDQGSGNFGNYPLYVGRRNNATLPFSGRIYGLIIRGVQTTDAKVLEFEKYVSRITGRQI